MISGSQNRKTAKYSQSGKLAELVCGEQRTRMKAGFASAVVDVRRLGEKTTDSQHGFGLPRQSRYQQGTDTGTCDFLCAEKTAPSEVLWANAYHNKAEGGVPTTACLGTIP